MSTTWKVVLAVVAVAIIGGVIYYFATKKPVDPKSTVPTNAPKTTTTASPRTETGRPENATA